MLEITDPVCIQSSTVLNILNEEGNNGVTIKANNGLYQVQYRK